MAYHYADIAFTDRVRLLQEANGSREHYQRVEDAGRRSEMLDAPEAEFIAARDGFFLASVGETGWPYVQFRGGPAGFLKVIDQKTIGFADFRGNRQYISFGNLAGNNRVALILMDWANRRRLKIMGRARALTAAEDPELADALMVPGYTAKVDGLVLIQVEAFDWNCPSHITPRFTEAEVQAAVAPLQQRLAALEAENARLRGPEVGGVEG